MGSSPVRRSPFAVARDLVIDSVVEIAKRAKAAGAEIVFLTGRAESFVDDAGHAKGFRADTMKQLARAGLPTDDEHLFLKGGRDVPTAPYKERVLAGLASDGEIGFFITEGRRDVDHMLKVAPDVACFLLGCTFERTGPPCEGAHQLPEIF